LEDDNNNNKEKFGEFKNKLLEIFNTNFERIIDFFEADLYYILYFIIKYLNKRYIKEDDIEENYIFLDQNIQMIENDLKINENSRYRFDFSSFGLFIKTAKQLISSDPVKKLFFNNPFNFINDTLSYTLLCFIINENIYMNESLKIVENQNGGNFISELPLRKNLVKKENYTIQNFYENNEKRISLKSYFDTNKINIIKEIINIINIPENSSLKLIVYYYFLNKKPLEYNYNNEAVGDFEVSIKNFINKIIEKYNNFLKEIKTSILDKIKPSKSDYENNDDKINYDKINYDKFNKVLLKIQEQKNKKQNNYK
jgi:hypothetical protein